MFILLMFILIIASITLLIVKRNQETFYLFGMCLSLALMLTGILIYISKKGGISKEFQQFLFLSTDIKVKIQYILITLDSLGYMIAIGRYLFPLFLILLALHYSMIPYIRRHKWTIRITFILPLFSLFIYYPTIFRIITTDNAALQQLIITFSNVWILVYVGIAVFLLLYEAHSISIKFFRRRFLLLATFFLSLALLYVLYFGQDPAQVYQFYSNSFVWKHGIYYLKFILPETTYTVIVLGSFICAMIGFSSLLKYTKEEFDSTREEIVTQRKFNDISLGTSIFVHSIKNQLLANRVISKRIERALAQNHVDLAEIKEYTEKSNEQNESILERIEELYRSVKTNAVHLIPIRISVVINDSVERFHKKYPNKNVNITIENDDVILADQVDLAEAIANLLTNAQEAITQLDEDQDDCISLICYTNRLYNIIEVRDIGIGMSKSEMKRIFEPFYSSKNSNYNWGMGLHYVREIAKEHFGSLRFESVEGEGSTFYFLLPKFKVRRRRESWEI